MTVYRPVRALERGISVLSCLASHGPSTPRAISERIGIDRATVYRLLQTLAETGYVHPASGGRYILTERICDLAAGFRVADALLCEIRPILHDLHEAVLWPVSYASLRGDMMVVEESTLSISPYAIHVLKPGTALSITRTAVGRSVLAAIPSQERRAFVSRLLDEDRRHGNPPISLRRIEEIINRIERVGYAYNVGDFDPKMSGLALALKHNGTPIGAICLIFFTKSISIRVAAERYLPAMRSSIARLEAVLHRKGAQLVRPTPQLRSRPGKSS